MRGAAPRPTPDRARQREVVDAFLAAARDGDFEALLAVLDPDVVLRADEGGGALQVVQGAARSPAGLAPARPAGSAVPALVDGAPGAVGTEDGVPVAILAFTVAGGRIVAIDALADRDRVAALVAPGI